MKGRLLSATAFLGFTVAVGTFIAQFSWNGVMYLSDHELGNTRSPAAIRRDLDFSLLNGADLITASQKRLITAARTVVDKGDVGVELGHFVTRGPTGKRELACDIYDSIVLRFEAEGIAEAGEKPTMEIESPCLIGRDITMIQAVWIPVQRILNERPADMDLQLDQTASNNVAFHFSNMPSEWPTQWRLQSVRMTDTDTDGNLEVSIGGHELRQLLSKPILLSWRAASEPKEIQ